MILILLPFLFLHYFNNPSADDFGLAENTKLFGFLKAQELYYTTWTGKYFSCAALSFNPLYFNSIPAYKVLTFLLMILFFYLMYLLIKEFTGHRLAFKDRLLFSLSIFFLYLYSMPSIAHSFYWLTATIVYQLGLIMIMYFLFLYFRMKSSNSFLKKVYIVVSSLLIICIVGCSEMAMAIINLTLLTMIVVNLMKEKKINRLLIFYMIIWAIASYFVVSAPGNKVREQMFPGNHQFINSIVTTFSVLMKSTASWIFNSPLLLITILLLPVFFKIANSIKKNSESFLLNPLYTLSILLIFLFALIFLPVWSVGKEPYSRTMNVVYFAFLAGWFYNVIVTVSYFTKKYNLNSSLSYRRISAYIYILAFIGVCLFLVKKNNVRQASADLLRGTAYKYNNELNQRYNFIVQNNSDSCEVTRIENIPRTLYVSDISSDPNEEFNKKYAHYFNKKSIILKESVKKPKE